MFRPYMAIIRFSSLKVSLYKLRCGDLPSDYISSMRMYRRVLYYIDICIYCLSVRRGGVHPGGVRWMSTSSPSGGCCHEAVDGCPTHRHTRIIIGWEISTTQFI